MKKEYLAHCGQCCQNCHLKAVVLPSANTLIQDMLIAGFESFGNMLPNYNTFWDFLQELAKTGGCRGCGYGSGSGNPFCAIRICAQEKNYTFCIECKNYPCALFERTFEHTNPWVFMDNQYLQEQGLEKWLEMQENRFKQGFTYAQDIESEFDDLDDPTEHKTEKS